MPITIQPATLKYKKENGQYQSADCLKGDKGDPGDDGFSPAASVSKSGNVATITVTDKNGTTTATVTDGSKGDPGDDGFSPTAAVTKSGKVATITITDKNGTTTQTVNDGADGDPTILIDDTAGTGDTDKTWSADKLLPISSDVTSLKSAINVLEPAATSGDVGKFLKAKTVSDGKVTEYEFGEASGGGGVSDVQIDGASVVSQGVANIPLASSTAPGVVKAYTGETAYGVNISNTGIIQTVPANDTNTKEGTATNKPITPNRQHRSVFYGLAKAAGDSTQSASSNAVGTYTESAKSAISDMLNAPETISGSTPSITAKAGVRYICGECSTLTIVVPASGIIDVVFESGSTATVLTVTPPTGQTMKWIGADPTALEANKTYEVNIMDGCYGMVVAWT